MTTSRTDAGFSLVETLVSILILSVGVLGLSQAFISGVRKTIASPYEVLATQKAAEAVESVFAARDSHTITWPQLKNASEGGVFMNTATPLNTPGVDGIVNTPDDGGVETFTFPGPDGAMSTGDDKTLSLIGFTRRIQIVELSGYLRQITVTITYPAEGQTKTYEVVALISQYA